MFTGPALVAVTLSVVAHALLKVFVAPWFGDLEDWVPVAALFFALVPRETFLALALWGAPLRAFLADTVVVAFLYRKFVRPVDILSPSFARGNFTASAGEALSAHALSPAGVVHNTGTVVATSIYYQFVPSTVAPTWARLGTAIFARPHGLFSERRQVKPNAQALAVAALAISIALLVPNQARARLFGAVLSAVTVEALADPASAAHTVPAAVAWASRGPSPPTRS